MPIPYIEEIASKTDLSVTELEKIWNTAINEADKKKIANKYAYATAAINHVAKAKGMDSDRFIDANGALICPNSVITGADVANYFGGEIPNCEKLGLNARQVYRVYRPIEEMQDNDFNGKHVLERHIGDFDSSTFAQYKDDIVGVAYDCIQDGTEIKGTIAFNDPKAIDALEDGKRYLSAGYWYDPVMEKGVFNGNAYDIKMTNIRANHIAHVENPRYKQAVVGDNDTVNKDTVMKFKGKYPSLMKQFAKMGMDEDLAEKAISAMDEKEQEEAEKKAQDACAKDEEEKKKAEDEKSELEDDKKKAEDELEKIKGEVVHAKEKGMDADAIGIAIATAVKAQMDAFKNEFTSQNKAMDSAMSAYTQRFGAPTKAFDSPDSIYDAILGHEGIPFKGKSLDQKVAMVETLSYRNDAGSVHVAMDSMSGNGDFSYLSENDRKLLGV